MSQNIDIMQDTNLDALFEATADATEEAIYNALCMAEDMKGPIGREVFALDLENLKSMMDKHYSPV